MNKCYAGIGARTTPEKILLEMRGLAEALATLGYVLRSGGAKGADNAFEIGCNVIDHKLKEIYLPWQNFNDNPSRNFYVCEKAIEIALKYHPNPEWLRHKSPHVLKLMARNSYQVLGSELNHPVDFVVCWTQDGVESNKTTRATGGTGQAIRIAQDYSIPVYNLKNKESLDRLIDELNREQTLFGGLDD